MLSLYVYQVQKAFSSNNWAIALIVSFFEATIINSIFTCFLFALSFTSCGISGVGSVTIIPFERAASKYKGRILWYLHAKSIMRYGELRKTLSDITPKMLTQTLRELEDDDLINRKVYHEVPPKVEYSLTEIGAELIPFIAHLRDWGDKQIAKEKLKNLNL